MVAAEGGPRFRDDVARLHIDAQAATLIGYRGFALAAEGEPAPEHGILKAFTSEVRTGTGSGRHRGPRPRRHRSVHHRPARDPRRLVGRPVPASLRRDHRRGHQRDPAQHHRRAHPGTTPAVSTPRAQPEKRGARWTSAANSARVSDGAKSVKGMVNSSTPGRPRPEAPRRPPRRGYRPRGRPRTRTAGRPGPPPRPASAEPAARPIGCCTDTRAVPASGRSSSMRSTA